MKKLYVLLFILGGVFATSAQNYLTVGQVYNFNVGDVFEAQSGYSEGGPPIYGLTIVLAKWYSVHSDTVFYKDSLVSYIPPACPPPCVGSFSTRIQTFSYTNLSSIAVQEGSYCPQTWDTLYNSALTSPYCGRKVWEVGPDTACWDSTGEAPVNNTFSSVVQGCGGPYYTIYTFDIINDIPYTEYYSLIYYKKNDTVCGLEYVITGINPVNQTVADFRVYPNPSNGLFNITFSHPELVSRSQAIEVYNVLGGKVYDEMLNQVQHDDEINLSAQPNGIYLYRVIAEDGSLLGEGKLVIQK